jgi:hypothetical protein
LWVEGHEHARRQDAGQVEAHHDKAAAAEPLEGSTWASGTSERFWLASRQTPEAAENTFGTATSGVGGGPGVIR